MGFLGAFASETDLDDLAWEILTHKLNPIPDLWGPGSIRHHRKMSTVRGFHGGIFIFLRKHVTKPPSTTIGQTTL